MKPGRRFARWLTFVGAAGALSAFAISGATAQIGPPASGLIYSCVNKSSGTIKIVSETEQCKNNEDVLNWNGTGLQGPAGPQGAAGPQGETGPAGPQGETGPQGEQGLQGEQGPGGPAGVQGAAGPQGETGPQGPQGEQGLQGEQGVQGEQGLQGDPGPAGAQGAAGPQGETGPQGPQGEQGLQGEQGAAGQQGDTGPQGNTGPQGPQGDPGPQGSPGTQGSPGAQGATGATGAQGPPGVAGVTLVTVRVPSSSFNSTSPKTATATCAAGQKVLGGGMEIHRGTLAESDLVKLSVVYNKPTATLDGWTVQVVEANPFGETWALTVYAVCATVGA